MARQHTDASASSRLLTVLALISAVPSAWALSPTVAKGCYSSSSGLTFQGTYMYQSIGYCQQQCVNAGSPVMGLTNGGDCWCGNLTPPTDAQVSDSQCSTQCNGYPQQMCGGDGAYSILLTGLSGSVGSADDDSGSSSSGTGSSSSGSGSGGDDDSDPPPPVSSDIVLSTVVSTGHPTTKTLAPQTITAPGGATTIAPSVVTVGGGVTQVVTLPASTATIANAGQQQGPSASPTPSSHTSTGAKVGIAVGIVIAVLAAAAGIGFAVFYFLKKKRSQYAGSTAGAPGGLNRNNTLHSYSTSGGFASNGATPGGIYGRAGSVNDSRLDPGMVETRRGSVGSMFDDSEDYSRRVLKVTNPSGNY